MGERTFSKPAKSEDDLVDLLVSKGLNVQDCEYAKRQLRYVGYYRLKIYMQDFKDGSGSFSTNTNFQDIVDVYDFDRRLRLVCMDALERIEVALRSSLINVMGLEGGPHFYYDEKYFSNKNAVTRMRAFGENAKHLSIQHYKDKYDYPYIPAIWCLTEATTFGQISNFFADLKLPYRKKIAKNFDLDEKILVSWVRCLASLRNICAHHGRLWNAELVVNAPRQATAYQYHLTFNSTCYSRLVLLRVLTRTIDPNGTQKWLPTLRDIIDRKPDTIDLERMGFPSGWEADALWN